MAHAEICPVCAGIGKLREPVYPSSTAATPTGKTCHGCWGYGWVEVGWIPKQDITPGHEQSFFFSTPQKSENEEETAIFIDRTPPERS